jgi:hypothetical protein
MVVVVSHHPVGPEDLLLGRIRSELSWRWACAVSDIVLMWILLLQIVELVLRRRY